MYKRIHVRENNGSGEIQRLDRSGVHYLGIGPNNAKSFTSANFNLRHRWVGQHVGNVRTKFQSQPARSSKVIEVCVTSVASFPGSPPLRAIIA